MIAFRVMENAKKSEIAVIRECIQLTKDIPGLTYTFDALHCQRDTVTKIVQQHQHYLITVKGNQKNLYHTLSQWVDIQEPLSVEPKTDNSHKRIITRTVSVYPMPISHKSKWINSQRVVSVRLKGVRDGQPYCHKTLYISARCLNATEFQAGVQGRWEIENRLHWVRDVTLSEDHPPWLGGYAPVNWSVYNCWLITLIRKLGYRTIPAVFRALTNRVHKVFQLLINGFERSELTLTTRVNFP